jgi:hypothetical protein
MRTYRHHLWAAGMLAAVAIAAGCGPSARPVICPGPPLSEAELIELNNANADKVSSVRASADVEVTFRYEGHERTDRLRDGLLLLLKTDDANAVPSFLLRAVHISEPIFGAGVDGPAGEYYFWIEPPRGHAAARWGPLGDINRPGYESAPLDPVDLLSVLSVLPWPLRQSSRPVLSLPKDDPCLYDLLFFGPVGSEGRVQLRRQVWMDRSVVPPRPARVWLFDEHGRVTVDATLGKYHTIDVPDLPAGQRPVMPGDILLRYPQERDILSLRIRLTNISVSTPGSPVRAAMFRRMNVIPKRIEDARPLGLLEGTAAQSQPAAPSGENAP